MYKKSNSFVYKFVVNCQVFEITPLGLPYEAENWHAWSYEQYFSKHCFLDICRRAFKNGGFTMYLDKFGDLGQSFMNIPEWFALSIFSSISYQMFYFYFWWKMINLRS